MEEVGIKRITVHSEKAAAYMADGYARIAHKPGIAMAQSVGAANLAAGLQDAYLAHSPVITFTGKKPFFAQYRNAYQEILHGPMYEAVTKYNVNVDSGQQLPNLMRQAFREATSGAPRPVHLDLLGYTGDVIEDEIIAETPQAEKKYTEFPAVRTEPDDGEVQGAVELIRKAKRPVIVSGIGAVYSNSGEEIQALSESLSLPIASSCHGKGLITDTYSLNAGTVGTYSCACANKIVSEADLVIYVGSGVGDQVTMNWTIPEPEVRKIQIDIDPSELGRNYPHTFGVLGDAKKTLVRILQNIESLRKKTEWSIEAENIIREWKDKLQPLRNSDEIPIRPERLCKEISDALPPDAILVVDTGYSAIWTCSMVELSSPDQSFIRAAGSLGWAFPASLGAKCAAPQRPVVCFIGDGGFWYHIAELETARRWGLNTVTVVNNNSAFGQSIDGIDKAYGDKNGNRDEVYTFEEVNFARIAENIGCIGIRVEKPEEIAAALQRALASDVPTVVEVITDRSCKPETAWKPLKR